MLRCASFPQGPAHCQHSLAKREHENSLAAGTHKQLPCAHLSKLSAAAIKVLGQPGHNVVTFEIVAARGGVCILLSLLVGGLWGMHHLKSQRKNWPVLFIRGLSGGISMALYLVAIQNLPLADAVRPFSFTAAMLSQ